MGVHIYSVKANSEAGNIRVYIMITQKGQSYKVFSQGSPGVTQENSAGCLESRRKSAAGVMYLSFRIHPKNYF